MTWIGQPFLEVAQHLVGVLVDGHGRAEALRVRLERLGALGVEAVRGVGVAHVGHVAQAWRDVPLDAQVARHAAVARDGALVEAVLHLGASDAHGGHARVLGDAQPFGRLGLVRDICAWREVLLDLPGDLHGRLARDDRALHHALRRGAPLLVGFPDAVAELDGVLARTRDVARGGALVDIASEGVDGLGPEHRPVAVGAGRLEHAVGAVVEAGADTQVRRVDHALVEVVGVVLNDRLVVGQVPRRAGCGRRHGRDARAQARGGLLVGALDLRLGQARLLGPGATGIDQALLVDVAVAGLRRGDAASVCSASALHRSPRGLGLAAAGLVACQASTRSADRVQRCSSRWDQSAYSHQSARAPPSGSICLACQANCHSAPERGAPLPGSVWPSGPQSQKCRLSTGRRRTRSVFSCP
jgi:hypothetical protein